MSELTARRGELDGFETIEIATGALALVAIPALGGKISSLRDTRSGREWLWRHPRMPYRRVPHGSSYVQLADTGGWDECFPSVSGCAYPSPPWAGTAVQDHGELWSQTAECWLGKRGDTLVLHTRWQGVALPYRFERAIALTAGSAAMAIEYGVTNIGDAPLEYIWCAHALLAIEPGMRLLAPEQARFHRLAFAPQLVHDHDVGFPFAIEGRAGPTDLCELPEPEAGLALKLWSEPLPAGAGWAAVRAHDGELNMRWDVAELPQLAVWMNLGGWAGDGDAPYYNLGLEPCIGAQDSLAEAVRDYRLFASVPPRATTTWRLEVELRIQ